MTIPERIIGRELEVEYAFYPYRAATKYDPPDEEYIEIIAVWEDGKKAELNRKETQQVLDYIGEKIYEQE